MEEAGVCYRRGSTSLDGAGVGEGWGVADDIILIRIWILDLVELLLASWAASAQ